MTENTPSEESVPKAGPRTITITLPSWRGLGAVFLVGVLLLALLGGGVWGYRYLDHRQRLDAARNEITELFKSRQSKADSLLEVAARDAAQFQQELDSAQLATKSALIPLDQFASRQQSLEQDLGQVQQVFSELADKEQGLIQRYQLSPEDTLFSLENQEQFNQLQARWGNLNQQQTQLSGLLQAVVLRKDSLVVAEKKAVVAAAAAKKAAQAKSLSRARVAQSPQYAPVAVYGGPSYYNYSGNYYTAPIYGPNYYRRPYGGGYGYGPGWYGPSTSVGIGFSFR